MGVRGGYTPGEPRRGRSPARTGIRARFGGGLLADGNLTATQRPRTVLRSPPAGGSTARTAPDVGGPQQMRLATVLRAGAATVVAAGVAIAGLGPNPSAASSH